MKEELVKKYVGDMQGLKREVEGFKQRFNWGIPNKQEPELVTHESVIFFFSIIYKYLVFENVPAFMSGKGLDAVIRHEDEIINVEFERFSSNLLNPKHHSDEEIAECSLLVCWEDNSRKKHDCWKHIDVFELGHFWEETG
jgi:hypothetical protein